MLALQALRHASAADAVGLMLDILVTLAEQMIERGEKEQAAQVLALVLRYPLQRRKHAELLMLDLEAELCPRVIWDARANAETLTLEQMVTRLLNDAGASPSDGA